MINSDTRPRYGAQVPISAADARGSLERFRLRTLRTRPVILGTEEWRIDGRDIGWSIAARDTPA